MSRAGQVKVIRAILILSVIFVTVSTVTNVFLDNADVRALAEKTGCGPLDDPRAKCAMTKMDRTPIAQTLPRAWA